jgi:copper resistance protein C
MEKQLRRWSVAILALAALPTIAGVRISSPPAHLYLEAERPKADTVLAASPSAIVLWFSQEPLPNTTEIRMRNPAGAEQLLGQVTGDVDDPFVFQAAVNGALPPGKYTVNWRTISDDEPGGLLRDGYFAFTVAVP